MIILDTNVLSELMKATPKPIVVAWLDQQSVKSVWITAITAFEIRYGLSILPEGHRRQALEAGYEYLMKKILEDRVLPIDQFAADAAGKLAARRRAQGISVDMRDTLIASIALAQRAVLATRNLKDFEDIAQSIHIVNPFARRL